MKKMIMVVMMLAVMMTGCASNVKDVEKFEYNYTEMNMTLVRCCGRIVND